MILRKPFFVTILLYAFILLGLLITRGGINDLFRLLYLFPLILILGGFWAFFSVKGFSINRYVREERKQLGQILEQRFEIINNHKFIRPWLEVLDYSQLKGVGGSKVLAWITPKEHRFYSVYSVLKTRGQFMLGPTVLQSGDPFGLYTFRKEIPNLQNLLVLPYLVNIRDFPFQRGILPGGKSKRVRTAEVTPHASGVREYFPGDPLNRIHWPLTAKKNIYMVKEFDQEPMSDIWIFLDGEKKEHQVGYFEETAADVVDQFWIWKHKLDYSLPRSTFEYCVSAAASIGSYYIKSGQTLGFGCIAQKPIILPAEKGERQLGKILETLALLMPNGMSPLHGLVMAQAANLPKGSSVVLITSTTSLSLVISVDTLLNRDLKPIVVYINPRGFCDPPLPSTENIQLALNKKIPYLEINYGDSLAQVLEHGQNVHQVNQ
jgi:uncharacterized protein (DUF58 family)